MARLIRTEKEVEGRYEDVWLVVEEDALEQWPPGPQEIVGRPVTRVTGPLRARGEARYTADVQLSGMLHTAVLRSPHAYARVKKIDFERALAAPGVRAAIGPGDAHMLAAEPGFQGEAVAAVAADTYAQARGALELVEIDWEVREPLTDADEAVRRGQLVGEASRYERGDVDKALAEADVVVEAEYRTQTVLHNSFETHQSVCEWRGDSLHVYISTQFIWGVRDEVASQLGLPPDKVRVVCEFMGGGFGSKNGAGDHTFIAAELARRTGRPVRCALTRREENLASGNRNATIQPDRCGPLGRDAGRTRRRVCERDRLVRLARAYGRADESALRLRERPHRPLAREDQHAADEGLPGTRFRRGDVRARVPPGRARGAPRD